SARPAREKLASTRAGACGIVPHSPREETAPSRAIESRRAGVASQWRIRHKLMLGLVLVVGIMALLLGGTLRGLWSYYTTINIIRCKQAELNHAGEVKEAVAALKNLVSPPAKLDPQAIAKAADNVRGALDAYSRQLDVTRDQGYDDPVKEEHARGL